MINRNLGDLAKIEKNLQDQKQTVNQNKVPDFIKKGAGNNIKFDNLKNIKFDKNKMPQINIMTGLWLVLIFLGVYAYNSDLETKIENIPTLEKEVSVLKSNIEQQKSEISSLEKLNLDSSTLEQKEQILNEHLPSYSSTLNLEQVNKIYEVAKDVGLEVDALQKIELKRDDNIIDTFGIKLEEKGIANFLEDSWFTKYSLSSTSSEEVILRFKEKIEANVEFVFDGHSFSQTESGELTYSFSLKAFYTLNNIEDEK